MVARSTSTTTTTHVQHIAKPRPRSRGGRENGPHLADLRELVQACEGLPDDVLVRITKGHLGEGGDQDVEFSIRYDHPKED